MTKMFTQFDHDVTVAIQSWPSWLHPIMLAATYIGLPVTIIVLAAVIAAVGFKYHHPRIAYAQVASVIGLGANSLLKLVLKRVRPNTPFVSKMHFKTASFPSGHAFGSVAFYGLAAYLAYKYLPVPWNVMAVGAIVLLILLIGLSRIYLGAHYPTDVLGGWLFGALVLGLILIFIKP